jgi:hypothetical protein
MRRTNVRQIQPQFNLLLDSVILGRGQQVDALRQLQYQQLQELVQVLLDIIGTLSMDAGVRAVKIIRINVKLPILFKEP